jgi:hypothetical protein
MPVKEENKAVTVKDLRDRRKLEDKKNEQRMIHKGITKEPETLKAVWKDDGGDDEITNLKNSSPSNVNKIHPFMKKNHLKQTRT